MKNKWTILLAFTVIVLMFSVSVVPAYAQTGNQVGVELTKINFYWTDENNIENIPIVWSNSWFTNMMNTPDSGLPVYSPKVKLQTNLNLVRFNPDDPSIFTAQPALGIYTWDFNVLELLEPEHLPLRAFTSDDTLISKPRFIASRSVVPETLTDEVTEQTVTLTLKFEEPLPFEVNNVNINMGAPRIAYEQYRLVEGQFVSMVPVPDWNTGTDGVSAFWSTNPSNIEIGKTYTFQGILKSVKSPLLLGSPIFKPGVKVGYDRHIQKPMVTANSVTITDPDNMISATFTSRDVVDWNPFYSDNRFDFWFNPKVSQITPPPPPFYVLAPANVQIEPDTLNLKSNGEWITAYIEFPEVYDVKNIVVSTITLKTPSGNVPIDPNAPVAVGDYDSDGISDLMVKFDRSTVIGQLGSTDVVDDGTGIDQQFELKVLGQLIDETQFEGTDTIRVIKKGK